MGEFFARVTLLDLGATYQLGHRSGENCRRPSTADLTIFDLSNVTTVRICYCFCGEPGRQDLPRIQLLHIQWFPATLKQPGTTFTFRLLDFIHKLQTRSKINLYNVYETLMSIPNPAHLNCSIASIAPSLLFAWLTPP